LRKVAVADFEGICANTTFILEPADPNELLPELLPFIMSSEGFHEHSKRESKGSVNPYVNFSDLAWYEFALPPLEEQLRILLCLRAAQEVSENVAKLSADASSLVRAFQEHEIAVFNQKSPLTSLPDLCELITVGIVVTPAKYYVNEGGVPALRSLNVWPGRFDLSDVKHLSTEGHVKHAKSRLQAGDVVMVRTGDPGRPGNAAVGRAPHH
jgi:type I restriction enzyme S subunit